MSQVMKTEEGDETQGGPNDPAGAVNRYLDAFYSGDFDAARKTVSDEFQFEGPFLRAKAKTEFFTGAEGLRHIVRGHRVLHQWANGNDVCTFYEVDLTTATGNGTLLMSEWHTIQDYRLVSGRLVFDTAVFRNLVPVSQS